MKSKIAAIIIVLVLMPYAVWAETMSSTNYHIQLDSFGSGGLSTSTNYTLKDTIGEFGGETATSTNYQVIDGLIGALQDGVLTASLSTGSLDLGQLSDSSIEQARLLITVTTDAMSGYSVKMSEDGNLRSGDYDIDDVSDFVVTAGTEEYGFQTDGTSGLYNTRDIGITSALLSIISSSSAVTSDETTVYFKAAISDNTEPGSYAHTVTFSTVANF